MNRRKNINTNWSHELAYVIGLIASDGNLSKDGRHMSIISKDLDMILTFRRCLGINNRIEDHLGGGYSGSTKSYFRVQFGSVSFYKFLLSIGLTPAKSKTMGRLLIPEEYFFDFLRGSFDGDGTFYSYWDKRWHSSFMYYIYFISASYAHVSWIQERLMTMKNIKGHLSLRLSSGIHQLRYAKADSRVIIAAIYANPNSPRLERKYKKVYTALAEDV